MKITQVRERDSWNHTKIIINPIYAVYNSEFHWDNVISHHTVKIIEVSN